MTIHEKVLRWLAHGEVGASSKTMAFTALGIAVPQYVPLDGGDFGRCLKLLRAVPEVREAFPAIAALGPEWESLIIYWDELAALHKAGDSLQFTRLLERSVRRRA